MKSRTSFNFDIWVYSLLKETGNCWSQVDSSPILEATRSVLPQRLEVPPMQQHGPCLWKRQRTDHINSTLNQKYSTRYSRMPAPRRTNFNCIKTIVIQQIQAILRSLPMPLTTVSPGRGIQDILAEHLKTDQDSSDAFKTLKVFYPIKN